MSSVAATGPSGTTVQLKEAAMSSLDKAFTATVGSNGQLTVTFSKGAADNPIVSAIQVVPA